MVFLLAVGTAGGTGLEEAKEAWRKSLGPRVQSYFEKEADFRTKYARACRDEERAAATSANIAGELFWEAERERVEKGLPPRANLDNIPDRGAEIRKVWHRQLGPLEEAFQKLVAAKLPELDPALERLEIDLAGHPDRLDEWRNVIWTRVSLQNDPAFAAALARGQEESYGYVVTGDLARLEREAKSTAGEQAARLIDGISDRRGNWARSQVPAVLTVDFPAAFRMDRVRFQFWIWRVGNNPPEWYRYRLKVSEDGVNFETVMDRSQTGEWTNWQDISFEARPVRKIRLEGTHASGRWNWFTVTEMEAYCALPAAE